MTEQNGPVRTSIVSTTPSYYMVDGADGIYEAADVFECLDAPDVYEAYFLCAALKYGIRAGRKTADPTEDLAKLRDCVARAIEHHARREE